MPLVTPEEMGAIDAAAPEPVEVLIDRAGAAVARVALEMLGGAYGRRVVVVAGKGNNGADGRSAAARLTRRGVRVTVFATADVPGQLPPCDLVIDAAFGTGFRGEWTAPALPEGTPVLAVDIPSGVSGLTGQAAGNPLAADRTVTFAALKPGLVLGDGPRLAGKVTVADIGLDCSTARAHLVTPADVASWLPARPRDAHKWQAAVWLVAGSPGMTGAAHLATRAAQRTGAGYVRLSTPGLETDPGLPTEAVGVPLPGEGWDRDVLAGLDRFAALAVGPGLGRAATTAAAVRALVAEASTPMVVDGDGLSALADTDAGTGADTGSGGDTGPGRGDDTGADAGADSDSGADTDVDTGAGTDPDASAGTDPDAGNGGTGADTDTGGGTDGAIGGDADSGDDAGRGARAGRGADGDGARSPAGPASVVARRSGPLVLTPHDGEFARLGGDVDDPDRIGATRALAAALGCVVLRKGPTTVVADPDGEVLVGTAGDARLATAGTGDVLTGIIAALLALGLPPLRAAAAGAVLHGRAGDLAWPRGLVAGDLVDRLPHVLADLSEF